MTIDEKLLSEAIRKELKELNKSNEIENFKCPECQRTVRAFQEFCKCGAELEWEE